MESEDELDKLTYWIVFNFNKYSKKDFTAPILQVQETCSER